MLGGQNRVFLGFLGSFFGVSYGAVFGLNPTYFRAVFREITHLGSLLSDSERTIHFSDFT